MNIIRKISVGLGYPDKCIHYQVGKPIMMGDVPANVSSIKGTLEANGEIVYDIYISTDSNKTSVLWKSISKIPVVVEYLVDFE